MCLVALEDPGLTVFPTHRLLDNLKEPAAQEALAAALRESFDVEEVERDALVPQGEGPVRFGYIDAHFKRPFMLTLSDQAIADRALPDKPEPYRRLDTAVLEALILRGALGMTEDDISHFNGLNYSKDAAEARCAWSTPGPTTPRSSCAPRRSSRCARWRRPARTCRRSRPTSTRRCRPGCSSTRWSRRQKATD